MKAAELAPLGRRLGSLVYEILVILALGIFLFVLPLAVFFGLTQHAPGPARSQHQMK